MREILIDLSADETAAQYRFAGFEGEHNATELTVVLPQRLLGKEGAEYRFLFETASSEAVFSAPILPAGDTLSVKLTKQLMRAPILKAFVGCYVLQEGEVVLAAKSPEMLLGIQKSVGEGEEELSSDGGSVPGLVVEEKLSDSKNPISAAGVKEALEGKISRSELLGKVGEADKASKAAPVSEKAVADAFLPYLKKEEYVVDSDLSAVGKNPVSGEALSQRVAPAFRKKLFCSAALLDDVSAIEQKVCFKTVEQRVLLSRGESVTTSDFANRYVQVTEETYLKIRTVEEDKITFYDGEVWENYGQLSGSHEGVLSEYFSPEDYACIVPVEESYWLYKASLTVTTTPAAKAKIYQYGKNLCPIAEWEDFGPDRITSPIYWQNPPEGTYTFSAIVTKYPEDTSTNTRIKIAVYYTDGTSKAEMGDMDMEREESDGIPRLKKHTFTTEKGKTPKYFVIAPLDYSTRNVARRKAEQVQLEYSPVSTEFEAYREPKEIVSDAQGKGEILLQGENTTLYTLGNIIFSAEYNRDTGKVISRLEKAILDLGGTI